MTIPNSFRPLRRASFRRGLILTLLAAALPVSAGVGDRFRGSPESAERHMGIFPARAEPHGYSLDELARITAAFNVGDHSGAPPSAVDGSTGAKIQMIYTTPTNTFHLRRHTALYVPVFYTDDSPPVIGTFPNIDNREAVQRYVFSKKQMGTQYALIVIDGVSVSLDERHLAAVKVAALPDGGGTGYIVSAALVRPLAPGRHEIEISSSFTGDAIAPWCRIVGFCTDSASFSATYTVVVH